QGFDHAGAAFALKDQHLLPPPVQSPNPPLILGGRAGPKSVALAARYAAEYNAFATTPEDAGQVRATLDAACQEAGRDPTTLVQSMMIAPMLGQSAADADERARRLLDGLGPRSPLRGMVERAMAGGLAGPPDKVAAQLRAFEAQGVSRVFVEIFQ